MSKPKRRCEEADSIAKKVIDIDRRRDTAPTSFQIADTIPLVALILQIWES
jgi:hypothetical protein